MLDLRLAVRSLLRSPVVTAAAVLSLALGIGANAGIFSLYEQILLRPVPAERPDELVNLEAPGPKPGSQSTNVAGDIDAVLSYPMLRDLERSEAVAEAFAGLAGHRYFSANLALDGNTEAAEGTLVSGSYFPTLGLRPALGRLLGPADDRVEGAHPVAVLSHSYWRQRFAGEDVLGRSLVVNGRPLTIVGVAPRGFSGTVRGQDPRVFVPLSMREALVPGREVLDNRSDYWIYVFGRLRPGVSVEAARTTINAVYAPIVREIEAPLQEGMSEATLERFASKQIELEPGARGQSLVHEEASAPLGLLLVVSGFVLLIACANLANLLLVRALARGGDISIRLALGARRRQIVSHLLAESLVLAALGSALGWLVARATLRLFVSLLPSQADLALEPTLSGAAWVFLLVLGTVTGLVGLFPALQATRTDLATTLKGVAARASASRGAQRLRAVLATLQIALSMALLVAAGLFTHSLLNLSRVDLGIDAERLSTFRVSPELNGYEGAASRNLFIALEEEIAALPGVSAVSASMVPLVAGSNWGTNVQVEGYEIGPDTDAHSSYNRVGPGFFRTVGIELLAGRDFEPRDDLGAPKVAVVNEAFARKFGLGQGAVGKRMQRGGDEGLEIEIVGLARDAAYSEVKEEVPPVFYLPYRQREDIGSISFYVRSERDPALLLADLRQVVARLDPNLPVQFLQTMEMQVAENVFLDRMLTTLSTAFAVVATLLAAIGLYGVVAYSVAQRTREFGLRMALGADARRILSQVLGQVGWMTLAGGVIGLAAAIALGRVAGALLYELAGHDPLVLVTSALLLAGVALTAGLFPARRAARIDPMVALREE